MTQGNPFNISFGESPDKYISRIAQSNEILHDFQSVTPSSRVYVITGVRGSGKTVMMTQIARELSADKSWHVINLNPERDMLQMLARIKKQKKKLLLTIDEVTNNENVRAFASAFQIMMREEAPVFLLMTGLYDNIHSLQNQKAQTFLYRAPKIRLEPLNTTAIRSTYRDVFDIPDATAGEMARITCGYSFAFQVLGYLFW